MSFEQNKYFESGVRYENERVVNLLENELGAGAYLEDTEIRDKIIKYIIKLIAIKREQK